MSAPAAAKRQETDSLLLEILSQPSSPFREGHVIRTITHALDSAGVPWFQDPIGNLILGADSEKAYKKLLNTRTPEPLRVLIAHLDHPGFHGKRWKSPTELEFVWHGGSPTQHLEGAPVWIADREGLYCEGHLKEVLMTKTGRSIDKGVIEIPALDHREGRVPRADDLFGGLRFRAPVWEENDILYTKAADDLVGSYAITKLAIEAFGKKSRGKSRAKPAPFVGLLTRAEEVGYIGMLGHLELGWLARAKRKILCVSLETSRALPGAEIGKGPVLRQGDKFGVFHPQALRAFALRALKVLPDSHQKRVMDGGTCEGTTAMVYGLPTVGISVPLGNYHNTSFEGGPDSAGALGPAPEFVHRKDIDGLLTLCRALLEPKLDWENLYAQEKKRLQKLYREYRTLIRSKP